MNWEALDEYVKDLDLVWSSEFLELYRLKSFESGNFSESLGDSDRELEPFFRRKVPRDPQINIFALDMKGADLVNGYITKEFIYSGNDTRVYSNLRNIDINNLPTKWVREASYITVRPLLPNINNVEIEHIRSFMLPGENSHYIIGNNVFSSQDLVRGIHSSFPWKDVSEISFVRDNSWLKSEYTDRIANLKAADCSSNEFSVLPTISVEKDFTGFVLRGDTDLPCVSKKISLDSRERYIARININWEASVDNQMGFCLYSKSKGDCINKDKYFNTKDGFGNLDFTFPTVIEGSDEISLILYALNSKGERASITVRNISLFLSSSFEKASLLSERMESTSEIISLKNDETYSVNIPIVISDSAYIFDSDVQKSLIWQPSRAEDSTLLYSVSSDSGMKQKVFNQYMNQYQRLFNTSPSTKYLWFWEGENISNIPATLCLTYSGDDKCWVDNMFFTKEHTSFTHIFLPSKSKFQTLEASYNSISFASDSVNVLKSFVVMPIPLEWFEFQYSPIISDEYVEQKATKISNSAHSTFYEFKGSSYRKTLLTIPQSFSNGWSAIKLSKSGVKILGDDTVVSVNGWKQGWDISEIGDYQKIVIFYWPNLLAYFGYAIIIITIVTLSVFLIREKRNYGKR